jgi:hypothetical protein
MATAPAFAATPRFGSGLVSAANTNRDGTGTLVTIMSAGASGTKLETVRIQARDTTTAGMVRLFLWDGSSTYRLLEEIPVTAVVPGGTVQAFAAELDFSQPERFRHIPTGWSLVASTHNAEVFFVEAWGADY